MLKLYSSIIAFSILFTTSTPTLPDGIPFKHLEPLQAYESKPLTQFQPLEHIYTCGGGNGTVEAIQNCIRKWAKEYGQDPEYMISIARCESTFSPSTVNHGYKPSDGSHSPTGLFQFIGSTWARYTTKLGKPHYDVYNYEHQAEVAAFAFSIGGRGEWAC